MLHRLRLASIAGDGLTGEVTIRSDRDRRSLLQAIERSVRGLEERAEAEGTRVLDVQLVGQVCAGPSYGQWKADRERVWRRQGGKFGTDAWPGTIESGAYGALLLPLPAGRVGLAAGKNPRAIASPLFTTGAPPDGRYEDLVLSVLARWMSNPADGLAARLAPPVIEVVQRGRVVDRRLAGFGIAWPLPAPDGL